GHADEVLDKIRHPLGPEPPHHGAWDLVAHEIGKNRVVPFVFGDSLARGLDDLLADLAVVEELDVLRPGDGDDHAHAVGATNIKEPLGRHVVDADDIHPHLGHHPKI